MNSPSITNTTNTQPNHNSFVSSMCGGGITPDTMRGWGRLTLSVADSVIAQIVTAISAGATSAQSQLCHRAKRCYLGLFVWFISCCGILYRHFDLFTVHFSAPSRLGELLTIVPSQTSVSR